MRKILRLVISLCILGGKGFYAPVLAGQPQLSSRSSLPFFSTPQYRIGLGVAGEYMNSDTKLKIIPDETKLGPIGSSQSQVAKKLQVALCGEFGATLANHYYLGLLVSGRHSGARSVSSTPIRGANFFSDEFRINHYADVMIKPGYQLTPCFMLYGLTGPSVANWRHTTNQLDGNRQVVNTFKIDKVSLGVGLGLGCEYLFKKQYALSMDYTYHFFRSTSKSKTISYFDMISGPRTGTLLKKVQPSFGTIAVRFTMFFQI